MPFWLGWTKLIATPDCGCPVVALTTTPSTAKSGSEIAKRASQRFHRGTFLPAAATGLGCIFSISATTTASSFCKESLVFA